MPGRKFANKILIFPEFTPLRVKYKDVFDLKAFYETLKEWLLENGWSDESDHLEHWETFYGEKIDQSGAKELWINWRAFKKPEGASHLNYHLDIDFKVIGMANVEIVHDGQKIKTNKGELELKINGAIEEVYKNEFEDNSFLKQVKDLFAKRVYKKEVEQRKKEFYQELYVLQNFIKQWFKLKRYLPYQEVKSFYPSDAFPSHLKE